MVPFYSFFTIFKLNMRANSISERENPKMRKNKVYFRIFGTAIAIVSLAVFISGCTKEVIKDQTTSDPLLTASIAATFPVSQADTVVINPVVAVTFKSSASTSDVSASTLILKEGTIPVAGTVTTSGTTINFTPATDLKPETNYTATIKSSKSSGNDSGEHSWTFKTGKHRQNNSLSVVSVTPLKSATEVATTVKPTVTFSQEMTSSLTKLVTISLWQGTTAVTGTLTFSGKTATFSPTNVLTANLVYTGKVVFGTKSSTDENEDGEDNNKSASTFIWSFTTGGGGADVTPPTVLSVLPANNATSVATSIHPSATFSEAMNSATINTTTFTLMQGSTAIAGTVAYSGTTATFTPSSALAANTIYTGTITTGAKDAAGNALASNYSWSFTTATAVVTDVTPPTVLSAVPANNATAIATSIHPAVTFSEAMNSTTINTTTFTLVQGSTTVAGTVAYSGTTATFTPSSALAANMVYTGTITTGAKDAAGNAIASNYTWSFTTAPAVAVISFTTQVLPILQSKCMPCHSGASPSGGKTITNYTTVSALSNTQLDNANMYPKMGVTAAEQAIIKAWIAAGRLNN
jgi:hypothetical protein